MACRAFAARFKPDELDLRCRQCSSARPAGIDSDSPAGHIMVHRMLAFLSFPAVSDSMQWVVFALGAVTIIYVAVIRPSLRRRKDPFEKTPPLSLSTQRAVEHDMSNLLVEMSEMARQITSQLDTRAAKLEALIAEAERKIAELKRLSGSESATPTPAAPALRLVKDDAPPPDPRHQRIYTLADEGRSAHEIAQALNCPQGEIELILALRAR
jgi:hypothetical protein